MTRNLNQTLGNIDAVRAAANADPSSPAGAAFRDNQEMIGNDNRAITVDSILSQFTQDRNDATYYKSAASNALFAWGPDADRHAKLLIHLAVVGSLLDAY